ncbi:EAL domain-containing protein [Vibrio mangrovi]|uniref:EAL domain-containing protein n=1 Tax=Vibrio mangrovi TaxID=474394 RepID=A0A1Y6IMF9_9VIBR|nr:EAL domain-containing protein [Vibrio mangrovi]MDW6004375.1 EAL domain-containing protein [Vibrio mangrovi]SMR98826.1 Phytochrome-like protein cph2 [Vibrio mangrovi]
MRAREILLVDDEAQVLKALKRELRGHFRIIHCAQSAAEALDILANNPIELVVSDYRMPDVDGAELIIRIKQQYPHIISIILSGQADLEGISRALNEGQLYRFIEKPWDYDHLLETIEQGLQEAENRQAEDVITGVKNLRHLNQYIAQLSTQDVRMPVMAIIHIVNLGEINQQLGHEAGNFLLRNIANQLFVHSYINGVYRHSNKFIVLLPLDHEIYDHVEFLNQHITHMIGHDEMADVFRVCLTELPDGEITPEFLSETRQASQVPLRDNRITSVVCNDPENSDLYQLLSIQYGLLHDEFLAFYQPQKDMIANEIVGYEALARWLVPSGEYQLPAHFLPIIEKYNIIELLTEKILLSVIQCFRANSELLGATRISINVPGRLICDGRFYTMLTQCEQMDESMLSHLTVEVTEQDLIENFGQANQELMRLKSLGVACALDDFGTGYAGYEYLFELPFDILKIDGRFVRAIGENKAAEVVLESILKSARIFQISVVAEWVETAAQADLLRQIGCSVIQGYFVGPTLSEQELHCSLSANESGGR